MNYNRRRFRFTSVVFALTAGLIVVDHAAAQDFLFGRPSVTVGARIGYAIPSANSEVFDFTRDELTVEKSDFNAVSLAAELSHRIKDRLDVALGFGYEKSDALSEFREFVGDDGLPIEQTTSFQRIPLTLGAKFYLAERGRRISELAWIPNKWAPFVGAGGGWVWYEFEQVGEFVDSETLEIFFDRFTSSDGSPLVYATAGVDYSLGLRWIVTAEARYSWASANMGDDFVGFEDIDLNGLRAALGISIRL